MLADAGLVLEPGHILTPATVAARQLARMGVKRLLVIAADGTRVPLRDAGIEVALTGEGGDVDGVMLGWTKDFGAADLEEAAQLLWAGKPLYATSIAPHFAGAKGRLLGISGAVAAALHNATGVKAKVFGKPETIGLEDISDMLGIPAQNMVVIGDDPKLEIAMARKAGAFAVGVTTGTVNDAGFMAADADLRANVVLPGLAGLLSHGWW